MHENEARKYVKRFDIEFLNHMNKIQRGHAFTSLTCCINIIFNVFLQKLHTSSHC
jgi:hypothetical protein